MAQQVTTPFLPIINVLPAGFRWTQESAKKALEKGYFIRVGGQQISKRYLSGAKRSWASTNPEENQTVFHTGYRISGTPQNIATALRDANVGEQQIAEILASVITRDNWQTTMAETVAAEIANSRAIKGTKPVADSPYDWSQLLWFGQNLKLATCTSKTGQNKGCVTSPGRTRNGESLSEKIRNLQQGKVIDVSNMDINTGKGVRTANGPKTAKTGKFGSKIPGTDTYNVPIISNDINKYIRAIQLAYGPEGEKKYAADIDLVRRTIAGNTFAPAPPPTLQQPFPAAAPFRAPSPSPQPGATLAPPPVFTAAAVPKVASPSRVPVGTMGGTGLPAIPALGGLFQQQ